MSGARPQSWLDDGASEMFIPAALSQSKPRVIRLSVTKSQRLARVECSACVSSFKSGNWLERQQAKCLPSKMAGGNRLHKIVFYTSTITLTIAGGWGGQWQILLSWLFYFISFHFSHGARARTQDLKHTKQMLTTEQHSRPFMPSLN